MSKIETDAALSNSSDDKAGLSTEEERLDRSFKRIDHALTVTNLIPQIHDLFVQKGSEPEFWVSDSCELARGASLPVVTRYIWAVDVEAKMTASEKVHPGILMSDTPGARLQIQIGLDHEDLWKIGQRAKAVADKEGENIFQKSPDWWRYPFKVVNLTRPYNEYMDSRYFDRSSDRTGAIAFEAFVWGKEEIPHGIVIFNYPQNADQSLQSSLDNKAQKSMRLGLASLAKVIKGSPSQ